MAVDGRAQVVHDALADRVGVERLRDAERAGRERDRDHPADEEGEQLGVLLGDRLVEDGAQQEGGDHPEPGRDQDQAQDRGEPRPVGAEERQHPPAVELLGSLGVAHFGAQPRMPHEFAAIRRR